MVEPYVLADREIIKSCLNYLNLYEQPQENFSEEEFRYIFDLCTNCEFDFPREVLNDPTYIDCTKPNWEYVTNTMDKYFPNYEDIDSKLEYFYRLVNNDPILCKYFRRLSQIYGNEFDEAIELTDDSLINQDVFFEYFKLEPCGSIMDNFKRKTEKKIYYKTIKPQTQCNRLWHHSA